MSFIPELIAGVRSATEPVPRPTPSQAVAAQHAHDVSAWRGDRPPAPYERPPVARRLFRTCDFVFATLLACSDGQWVLLLRLVLGRLFAIDRQLQHGCGLAFAQTRHQHDLTAREFQRVVVVMR